MSERLKNALVQRAEEFVAEYQKQRGVNIWRRPLLGYADARHPYICQLKKTIGPGHILPAEILWDASIVVACFVPFTREVSTGNQVKGTYASAEWAWAYEITNKMLKELNQVVIDFLCANGCQGVVPPEAFTFDQKKLKSNWSHRHIAYAAGLGTFGVNRMLITKAGCSGRYTTIVTNLPVEPDAICEEEYCLYKKNGSCGVCVQHCPVGALTLEGYDRQKCYEVLKKNALRYTEYGSSYVNADGRANSAGSEVCGKCVVSAPCTYRE